MVDINGRCALLWREEEEWRGREVRDRETEEARYRESGVQGEGWLGSLLSQLPLACWPWLPVVLRDKRYRIDGLQVNIAVARGFAYNHEFHTHKCFEYALFHHRRRNASPMVYMWSHKRNPDGPQQYCYLHVSDWPRFCDLTWCGVGELRWREVQW